MLELRHACIRTGRKFIGIEKDAKHFATAVERISRELEQGELLPANAEVRRSAVSYVSKGKQ